MVEDRTLWLKRPWLWVFTIVLLAGVTAFVLSGTVRYVVVMTIASVTYGITPAGDVDKAAALEKAVVNKTTAIHQFARDSATYPGRPPISVTPGSRALLTQPPQIDIYETKTRQSRIKSSQQCKL
jgi:hypothetical protein